MFCKNLKLLRASSKVCQTNCINIRTNTYYYKSAQFIFEFYEREVKLIKSTQI